MKLTRMDATLWDCGCLSWTEDNKYMYLPCGQSDCRVEPIVKDICQEKHIPMIRVKILEEIITTPTE